MRRSDIARYSTVPGGADYIFTLLERVRARGRRMIAAVDLAVEQLVTRYLFVLLQQNDSVVTGSWRMCLRQTSHGVVLGAVLRRSEFTVISRSFQ